MTTPSRVLAALSRVLPAVVALTAVLALLVTMSPGASTGSALLAAAAAATLTLLLSSTGGSAWTVALVPSRAGGATGHVDAPTAYWCAVSVPRRPRQPRAPGRR